MKVVWELGPATVREVYEQLLKRRKIAYTTVMTMMNILEEKKHLKKRPLKRAYIYEATQPKARALKSLVQDFVARVFNGSAQPLLVQLVKDRKVSQKELRDILRTIEKSS